mgnify:CR=1 FL=1
MVFIESITMKTESHTVLPCLCCSICLLPPRDDAPYKSNIELECYKNYTQNYDIILHKTVHVCTLSQSYSLCKRYTSCQSAILNVGTRSWQKLINIKLNKALSFKNRPYLLYPALSACILFMSGQRPPGLAFLGS